MSPPGYQPYQNEAIDKIYNLLFTDRGIPHSEKEFLGIILEVSLPEGLDTLAAYRDGTARYINQTGKIIIWETQTKESDELIQKLFVASQTVVNKIGPWNGDRRPPPENGMVRMSFLVDHQLYFGEGPFQSLYNDPMGRPLIDAGFALMQFLIQQAEKKH